MLHHPDRNPGCDEAIFKEITEAYRLVGNFIEENRNKENKDGKEFDFEEEIARKTFQQFQFSKVKENMKSFTIYIENSKSFIWDKILTIHYGEPQGDNKQNGLHWKVADYSDGNLIGNITVGKWHIPKKDKQSKLHIQSNERGNYLPAHFVDNVLPILLKEVHTFTDIGVQGPSSEGSSRLDVRTKHLGFKCNECEFVGKNTSGLSTHTRLTHKKKPPLSTVKAKTNLDKDDSISMEAFALKFSISEIPSVDKTEGHAESIAKIDEEKSERIIDSKNEEQDGNVDFLDSEKKEARNETTNKSLVAPEQQSEVVVIDEVVASVEGLENEEDIKKSEKVGMKKDEKQNEERKKSKEDDKKKDEFKDVENKSTIEEHKVKKKQPKPKNSSFQCRFCDQKFGKIVQLTSHVKVCHTKNDETGNGNALTVNSPALTVKHFFCHCVICGGGFDDYSQLTAHESEHHSFRCKVCKEDFMIESDLDTHVTNKHSDPAHESILSEGHESQCEECGLMLKTTTNLKDHVEKEHTDKLWSLEEHNVNLVISENLAFKEKILKLEKELNEKNVLLCVVEEVAEEEKKKVSDAIKEKEKATIDFESKMKEVVHELKNCREEIKTYVVKNSQSVPNVDMGTSRMETNVSCQTDDFKCNKCEKYIEKCKYMDTLEHEHRQLIKEHDQFKKLYFKQADEFNEAKEKIVSIELENMCLKTNADKANKTRQKIEKETEAKMKDLNSELSKCYVEVDKHFQQNQELMEEVKTLKELRKVDGMLDDKKKGKEKENISNEDEVEEIDDEYDDDEEVASYFKRQAGNRKTRRGPQVEAEQSNKAATNDKHVFPCDQCDFVAPSLSNLKLHKNTKHETEGSVKCDKCKFVCRTKLELKLHMEAMRGENGDKKHANGIDRNDTNNKSNICRHWLQGHCRKSDSECRFLHKAPPRCRFQMECYNWLNCRFIHDEDIRPPCRFQEYCRNSNCRFQHYVQNQGNNFLDRNQVVPQMNDQNFPQLQSNFTTNQNQNPWMTW